MSGVAPRPRLVLYGRPGCHLCEDAERLLAPLAAEFGCAVETIDIDRDAALLARYDQAAPVVALDAVELARAPLRPAELRRRLRAALGE